MTFLQLLSSLRLNSGWNHRAWELAA